MTRNKCGKKTKKGKTRKHTEYTSEAQVTAGNIALAAKKGDLPKSKLKGASKQMAEGMTLEELESHSAEAKGKDLPKKVRKKKKSNPKSDFLGYINSRKAKSRKAKG